AIIIHDRFGVITDCNQSAEQLFAIDNKNLIGTSFLKLIEPSKKLNHDILSDIIAKNFNHRFETEFFDGNGKGFPGEVTVSEFEWQEQIFFQWIIRDITKQKETLQKIENSRETSEYKN